MKTYRCIVISVSLALFGMLVSCERFLDTKPDQKLVVPSTIQDLQGILDSYLRVNQYEPSAAEVSADNYYLTDADWDGLAREVYRRMYVWEKDNLFEAGTGEWSYCYDNVFRANTVLDNLDKIKLSTGEQEAFDNLKGQALALRARSFLKVAGVWAQAYDEKTADTDLGIPIRLNSDFNTISTRSTLRETYMQIISDLKASIPLLPVSQLHVLRTNKAAAYGLLARTYLFMGKYDEAGIYADSCLQLYDKLLDYNLLNKALAYPVNQFNEEVILSTRMLTPSSMGNTKAKIDPLLIQSYHAHDLRSSIFFKSNNNGTYGFKGGYEGAGSLFDGIATDEMFLIRAECAARSGQISEAMKDLNHLMVHRWDNAKLFVPYVADTKEKTVELVLLERRKELLMRGLRWMDIKRLNKKGADITLKRTVKGKEYSITPNDVRFALPIPNDVIALTGMKQNPR
ncbi:RagB/SusD family nutrient uptake outer membrane protein [Sphingobacterium paucimobilis]|uniref:SusD-like N-terminal domain-containing protein n=1 Tax=Sphingobacterium paucimobilis HER1398 TaxID=1346330 RepID=U2HR31_9SPHI|nr:RagB/SusD family nutrient uptake outer membrane protein [Sphingobacterium paucimobilis]ERJ57937.1 hypothetical protein M472_04075 [Sphingobacterium paucimobilis HER1398]